MCNNWHNVPVFYSEAAQDFIERWGDSPDAVDDIGRNLVTYLAGCGRSKGDLVCLESAIRHGYATAVDGDVWQSALHEAVDMHHWAAVDVLLRFPVSREHVMMALCTLLTHAEPLAETKHRARDEYRYALILFQRLGGASQGECRRLLCAAFNGSALAWFIPLMSMGVNIPPQEEWDSQAGDLWWYNYYTSLEGTDIFYRLMLSFFRERLPQLFERHRHRFTDFEVLDNRLHFTGNPAARLPLLCTRRSRERMKNIERSALLFAR